MHRGICVETDFGEKHCVINLRLQHVGAICRRNVLFVTRGNMGKIYRVFGIELFSKPKNNFGICAMFFSTRCYTLFVSCLLFLVYGALCDELLSAVRI